MTHLTRRSFMSGVVAACGGCALRAHAAAEEPRSLQCIVPTAPGTQPDLIARWLVEPIARRAGVPGVVLNRPGASGAIAVEALLNAAPETGSLLLGGLDHVAYSHLSGNRRAVDPLVDVVPVGSVNRDSWLVVSAPEKPWSGLEALARASRDQGPLHYASVGEGSTPHVVSARLCRALDIRAEHVPYKDRFLPDLIAGRIDFAVVPAPGQLQLVQSGKLRALAALTHERLSVLPTVPCVKELGWPDQVFHGGLFLFAQASAVHLAPRLNQWLVQALGEPEVLAHYREAAIEATPLNLDQTRQAVVERLQMMDGMRIVLFGRAR